MKSSGQENCSHIQKCYAFFNMMKMRRFLKFLTLPLWLVVIGPRRRELSLLTIWEAYQQRYDLEHVFRFGKQRLLMDAYQTPEIAHEENWWPLVQLAYLQLWAAREMADSIPRPWERSLPRFRSEDTTSSVASPSVVQRDRERILQQLGTPARSPICRGNAAGRAE